MFESHTVFENLELAMKTDKRVKPTLFARLTQQQQDADRRHAEDDPARTQRSSGAPVLLSHGQKQWLEIGMLLVQEPNCCCSTSPWPA